MISAKLFGKKYLYKNTFRLFFGSFLSFILRYGMLFGFRLFMLFACKAEFYSELKNTYTDIPIDIIFYGFCAVICFFILVFNSGIHLGESFMYFKRAIGEEGSIKLVFCFLKFKKAFKAFLLSIKLGTLKALWFIFFIFPGFFSVAISYYIYKTTEISPNALLCLVIGSTAASIIGFISYAKFSLRYSLASYYFSLSGCENKNAIKKSIDVTENSVSKQCLFKFSFIGWFFLCLTVFPIVYVIPYYKLSVARFLIETVNTPSAERENNSPIIIEKLLPLKNNYSV